jgi:hypothetical protein
MKNALYTLGFAALASISLLSCSKGDYSSGDGQTGYNKWQDVPPVTTTYGAFTAKINGSAYASDHDKAKAYSITSGGVTTWVIAGVKGSGTSPEMITLNIPTNPLNTILYDIASLGSSIVYLASGSSAGVMGTTGNVTITNITTTGLKGTFEMHAAGMDITEGSFDLPIIKN